ncbi:MAG: hypothetical protein H6577_09885 [Lewinellaceae bacterium]|nr:hypothetical protein [Saprospiraceae bacterium]MCB9338426.1 hypothetical protein [Lewinellaceae bacterium]
MNQEEKPANGGPDRELQLETLFQKRRDFINSLNDLLKDAKDEEEKAKLRERARAGFDELLKPVEMMPSLPVVVETKHVKVDFHEKEQDVNHKLKEHELNRKIQQTRHLDEKHRVSLQRERIGNAAMIVSIAVNVIILIGSAVALLNGSTAAIIPGAVPFITFSLLLMRKVIVNVDLDKPEINPDKDRNP